MLRIIKDNYIATRVMPISASIGASAITATSGIGDYSTLIRAGAGRAAATFKTPFSRVPITIGCPGAGAANGSFFANASPLVGSSEFDVLDDSGVAANKPFFALTIGSDSKESARLKSIYSVKTTFRKPRLLAFVVNGTGTASITVGAFQATLTDNGTGDYTLTFNNPFGTAPIVVATPLHASSTASSCRVQSVSPTQVNILTFNGTPSASDRIFHVWVLGFDATTSAINARRPIHTPQRKPRIIWGRVIYTGGVPSVSVNPGQVSVVDTGVGNVALTLVTPFKRAPICICSGAQANRAQLISATSTAVSLLSLDAEDSASDSSIMFAILGFDDVDEFGEN